MQGICNEERLQGESADRVFKNIWKSEGFKGVYRGLGCTIVREFIGCSVFFGVYERARELLKPVAKRKEDCGAIATMVAGSLAGICTSLIVYPIDVIKSRVQMTVKESEFQMFRNVILSNSSRELYSGLLPTMVKTVPVTGVLLLTVEFSKPFYRKYLSEMSSFQSDVSYEQFLSVCDFLSGWTAGIVSTLIGHPIDTVKVVQQVTNNNVKTTIKDIYIQDKFKGYFRGMMFPILSVGVANSVFFRTYGNVMRLIQVQRDDNQTNKNINVRFCSDAENLHKYWHLDVFISGCIAGFSYALINTPIEVIKTLLQARNITLKQENMKNSKKSDPSKTTSAFKLMIELYKVKGIRSLYRGGILLFIRDVQSMGIYVLSYEHLCSIMMQLSYSETKIESMPIHVQIMSGGVAGLLSWILVLPFDVIKSKIITDSLKQPVYKSAWDCAKKTYNNGGGISFFRGFWSLCLRAFPVNGIAFVTYETMINNCSNGKTDQLMKTTVESKWM
ncbi:solute carrier family 25 member 45-like [Myzus persicae]|uniref:solute carrier family 25 member 45-like n=1 Tax=Myzus persicae TaxID=13164 RepID=UPI000B934B0E|nr:solute carrier family 25 member 45-like [Myzus persicae]